MKKLNFLPALFLAAALGIPMSGLANNHNLCCEEDSFLKNGISNIENEEKLLKEIVFIEDEIELGFDTVHYLPHDFDPYSGMEPDLSEIQYIEECELFEIEVDVQKYLPEGFNPYVGQ